MDKRAFVYMPTSCYNRMLAHIHIDTQHECGGFLIGDRVDMDSSFVFSIRELYYEPIIGTYSSFDFTTDYTSRAQEFEDAWRIANKSDDYLVGTYHSHATFDAFHSTVDDVYAKRFNLMIICSPSTRRIEVWYWSLAESRWFEGDLIVYDDECKTKKRRVVEEDDTVHSGKELFASRIFRKTTKTIEAKKKVLIVGCGTLGNLLAEHFLESNPGAELTFLDRDYYETANLPRSPVIDNSAVGKPKAFALAEAVARDGRSLYSVRGIVGDVRKFGLDFFERFDVIVSPLDNLECRFYLSYCATVLKKPFVNLGSSYTGLNGQPAFSGDVFYKPANSEVCLDCFYPLYGSNEKFLQKRVSCGGALPEEVVPQVISSSMLIASVAFLCIKRALANDNSKMSVGYNISDVVQSECFFEASKIKRSNCCDFAKIHDAKLPPKTICISERTQLSSLYNCIQRIFKDGDIARGYEIDMIQSGLTQVKYRTNNPIHSIVVDRECVGRLYHLIKDDYFPMDYIYVVNSPNESKLIRIKIKERNQNHETRKIDL